MEENFNAAAAKEIHEIKKYEEYNRPMKTYKIRTGILLLTILVAPSVWAQGFAPTNDPKNNPEDCGTKSMLVSQSSMDGVDIKNSPILISSCGFRPSIINIGTAKKIKILNQFKTPLTVTMLYEHAGRKITEWTQSIGPMKSVSIPVQIKKGHVAMLYSKSNPELGLVALVHPMPIGQWKLNREPLEILQRFQ